MHFASAVERCFTNVGATQSSHESLIKEHASSHIGILIMVQGP